MTLFLICLFVILLVIAGMAVGAMSGREPIKGSCGGLNKLGLRDGACPICGDDPTRCETVTAESQAAEARSAETRAKAASLGRDAS